MKLLWLIEVFFCGLTGLPAQTPNPAPILWEQPAAALAEQIAGILGPGQARLTIRNASTIPSGEIPAIRLLLEQDLKAHGVLAADAESANAIRVTLSENMRERLWVAEVIEGKETRVEMARAGLVREIKPGAAQQPITLRRVSFWSTRALAPPLPFPLRDSPRILAAADTNSGLVVLDQEEISIYARGFSGWDREKGFEVPWRLPLSRDRRGTILPAEDGSGFIAFGPGLECKGSYTPRTDNSGKYGDWSIKCNESDDPWPILTGDTPSGPATIKAFYSAARNYFTGLVTPSPGVDLPPFYSAALIPRAGGLALLIGGIDGKAQILEGTSLKPVAGTRDWGSDFAVLNSGCGAGAQVIASGSGEAASDSLRAFELPAQEAIPASAPLAMEGTVMALWAAPDGKSVFAVVRGAADQYEVDRVTASCNE